VEHFCWCLPAAVEFGWHFPKALFLNGAVPAISLNRFFGVRAPPPTYNLFCSPREKEQI
jgi:hypothetical protein